VNGEETFAKRLRSATRTPRSPLHHAAPTGLAASNQELAAPPPLSPAGNETAYFNFHHRRRQTKIVGFVQKTPFLSTLYIKTIILPRQPRDKRKESTQKKDHFTKTGSGQT
jgi:hypothetical protein